MKRYLILYLLCSITNSAFSQIDRFSNAISVLQEIAYYVVDSGLDSTNYHISIDKSDVWINQAIEKCNSSEYTRTKHNPMNLDALTSYKHVRIKSKNEIQPHTYPQAELFELNFQNEASAQENELLLDELYKSIESECVNKAPWIYWRIENRIYFIVTRATLFGQEIPKMKAKMNDELIK